VSFLLIDPDKIGDPRTILHGQILDGWAEGDDSRLELRMVFLKLVGDAEVAVGMEMAAAEEDAMVQKGFKGGGHDGVL
jgi:hypothetical protein